MKNLTFSKEQVHKIYQVAYSISESRSKVKQHIMNDVVIESLRKDPSYDGCEFKTEVRIPKSKLYWGKYFPIDICVYKDGDLIEVVLIKAPASNLRQNSTNTLNSMFADISRIKIENLKRTLINFSPRNTPYFKRDETISKFEKKIPEFLTKSNMEFKFELDEIYVMFDIDNLHTCKTKSDVKNLFSSNPIKNIEICS